MPGDYDKKILVVDDAVFIRNFIRTAMKMIGLYQVSEAADGRQAWGMIQTKPFDLIISDWQMPEMDGLELLKHVRAEEKVQHIPFLMLTSTADPESVRLAAEAGVSDYLAKPFRHGPLASKVEKLLGIQS